jgi:hypothetical protein
MVPDWFVKDAGETDIEAKGSRDQRKIEGRRA